MPSQSAPAAVFLPVTIDRISTAYWCRSLVPSTFLAGRESDRSSSHAGVPRCGRLRFNPADSAKSQGDCSCSSPHRWLCGRTASPAGARRRNASYAAFLLRIPQVHEGCHVWRPAMVRRAGWRPRILSAIATKALMMVRWHWLPVMAIMHALPVLPCRGPVHNADHRLLSVLPILRNGMGWKSVSQHGCG